MEFTVTFPCKPYTRVFIEQNFGKPTRFNHDKCVMMHIRLALSRNDQHNNHLIQSLNYEDQVTFMISEDDFNRYGITLSYNCIQYLNRLFEDRARKMMLSFCSSQFEYGMKPYDAIKLFQEKFGYPEHIWKFESIYKYCQRKGAFLKKNRKDMEQRISIKVLEILSAQKTITRKGKLIYEEN